MKAITVARPGLGVRSMMLTDIHYPPTLENDVIVRVHVAAFAPDQRVRGRTIITITETHQGDPHG